MGLGLLEDCPLENVAAVLEEMERRGSQASPSAYAAVLRRCGSDRGLEEGKRIHEHLWRYEGLRRDRFIRNCLADMYGKCGRPEDARTVFDGIAEKNVFSWTIIITAYAENEGTYRRALEMFRCMDQEGVKPNSATFVSVLMACSSGLRSVDEVISVHARVSAHGFDVQLMVGTALVNAYGKCGAVELARLTFEKLDIKNKVSWTAIITAYAQNGHSRVAVDLYMRMLQEGLKPDRVTFVSLLDACSNLTALSSSWIQSMTGSIRRSGFGSCLIVAAALLNMYGKHGKLEMARNYFNGLQSRNVVIWNVMIATFGVEGHLKEAVSFYWQMNLEGTKPDGTTFTSLVNACASVEGLSDGIAIYGNVLDSGTRQDDLFKTVVLNMYGKCGRVEEAEKIFDEMVVKTVVPWTALMSAYVSQGRSRHALTLFRKMELEGISPTEFTFVVILDACAKLGVLHGRQLHARVAAAGFTSDPFVSNTVMKMYAACGSITDTRSVFDTMGSSKNLVSWNCMIEAYAQHCHSEEALDLYQVMELEGVKPNGVTLISILSACSHVGLVQLGHEYFVAFREDYGIQPQVEHYGCLVDLLGRSGRLETAEKLIENVPPTQSGTAYWGVLLGACKTHGDTDRAARIAKRALGADETNAASLVTVSNMLKFKQSTVEVT